MLFPRPIALLMTMILRLLRRSDSTRETIKKKFLFRPIVPPASTLFRLSGSNDDADLRHNLFKKEEAPATSSRRKKKKRVERTYYCRDVDGSSCDDDRRRCCPGLRCENRRCVPEDVPTVSPTASVVPTIDPTVLPSDVPTEPPTFEPTATLTTSPSEVPTSIPTIEPSADPTDDPTSDPTSVPSSMPSEVPSPKPSSPTVAPSRVTYVPGDLAVRQNGLLLSRGLISRAIAETGKKVRLKGGIESDVVFHDQPDAGAIFDDDRTENRGGWVYVSNAEVRNNGGGVGAITFDSSGEPVKYEMVLEGTDRNCGGGKTFWNTWISCEESGDDGQIWEVDPFGNDAPNMTVMGGRGGNYESMAYDDRIPDSPKFFVTNDRHYGEIRRFAPNPRAVAGTNRSSILTTPGTIDYLVLHPDTNTFDWTYDLHEGKRSAGEHFRNCEGIDVHDGYLYFVSKKQKELFVLNLDERTYVKNSTRSGVFDGQPDQVVRVMGKTNRTTAKEDDGVDDVLYFTEDGGRFAGVHGRDAKGNFLTILEAIEYTDETTGLAFSPDRRHMYFAVQDEGILFDVTREDGLPFGGKTLQIKYHADRSN